MNKNLIARPGAIFTNRSNYYIALTKIPFCINIDNQLLRVANDSYGNTGIDFQELFRLKIFRQKCDDITHVDYTLYYLGSTSY